MKIIVVVVTYNRLYLLKQCLLGIAKQDHPIDQLLVIDNASADGTSDWCVAHATEQDPPLTYYRLDKNTGGAGGFAKGISLAYEYGGDLIWIMDDDVVPDPTCLSALISNLGQFGVIHPTRINPNGERVLWHHWIDPISLVGPATRVEETPCYTVGANVMCFEGALIKREVIDNIGIPFADFFIGGDDTLFGLLISGRFAIGYTSKAKMQRLLENSREIAGWKRYYLIRNAIWTHRILAVEFKIPRSKKLLAAFIMTISIVRQLILSFKAPKIIFECMRGIKDGVFGIPEKLR